MNSVNNLKGKHINKPTRLILLWQHRNHSIKVTEQSHSHILSLTWQPKPKLRQRSYMYVLQINSTQQPNDWQKHCAYHTLCALETEREELVNLVTNKLFKFKFYDICVKLMK